MDKAERRGFPWGLTVATLAVLGVLIALGSWQARRLVWKEGLIATATAAAQRPAAPLAQVLAESGDAEFRAVTVDCPGLATAPFVEMHTILDGQPGLRLISACRAADRTWLVDRGFVAEEISARPPVTASEAPTPITAQIRTPTPAGAMTPAPEGRLFYGRDAPAMARVLGVSGPVEPRLLYALTPAPAGWAALQPAAPPAAFSNNHLGYALTWFGLAAVLAVLHVALVVRRLRS